MCVADACGRCVSFSTCAHRLRQHEFLIRLCCCLVPINRITSEDLGPDAGRLLLVKGLQESDSGVYRCTAAYASSQKLEAHVNLTTIGASPLDLHPARPEIQELFSCPFALYLLDKALSLFKI